LDSDLTSVLLLALLAQGPASLIAETRSALRSVFFQSLLATPRPAVQYSSASSASSDSTDLADDPAVEVVEMVMEPYFMQVRWEHTRSVACALDSNGLHLLQHLRAFTAV
jgi:hypothetical protein